MQNLQINSLYKKDFNIWTKETVKALKSHNIKKIDFENIAEEIEEMSKRDRRELKSRLIVLLAHLLKYHYQPTQISPSWRATIREQRRRIGYILDDSPSLKSDIEELGGNPDNYKKATLDASEETGLPESTFPINNPYTTHQILDENYHPKM